MLHTKQLFLRPHHTLCLLLFNPAGHSTPYSNIMRSLLYEIAADPTKAITMTFALDVICTHCPHNEIGVCSKEHEVTTSDEKVLSLCDQVTDDPAPWSSLRDKLCDQILNPQKLADVCHGCVYLERCERVAAKGEMHL